MVTIARLATAGWDLSIGSIARSTRHGKPDYTENDTFVLTLKGMEMTLVREQGEYRLKDEGLFLRVLRQGDAWVVFDKQGTQYHFGASPAERQSGPDGIFKWSLSRIEDPSGNAVLFTYETDRDNNQLYLQQISYDVHNYITFESAPRNDVATSYASFFEVRTVRRLETISVFNGGLDAANLVRRYQLAYKEADGTGQSLLTRITQYGSNGTALPPVCLDYTTSEFYANRPFSQVSSDTYPSSGENVWTEDFTGDGRSDFLVTPGPKNHDSGWQLYQHHGDGFQLVAEGPDFNLHTRIHPGDFNGDGRTDIMASSTQGGAAQIYLSNGHGFEPPVNGPVIERESTVHLTDFNADGKSDILIMFCKEINEPLPDSPYPALSYISYWEAYLNVENDFQLIRQEGNRYPDQFSWIIDLVPGDFNGDGKTDFLFMGGGMPPYTALYYSSGTDIITSEDSATPFLLPEEIDSHSRFHPGDFNGDGKTDLLAVSRSRGSNDEGFRLFISTGSSFVKIKEDTFPNGYDKIHTADFNGDGRTDLLVTADRTKSTDWAGHRLLLSTGRGFISSGDQDAPGADDRFHLGDFNGDGCMDFMVSANINYSDWQGYQLYLAETTPRPEAQPGLPLLLGSVTNMLGATTQITYTPSSRWPKDIDGDGTHRSMPLVLPTVSRVTVHDNMQPNRASTTAYAYEDGYYNLGAREFRGFGKVAVQDQTTHLTAVNYYHQQARFQGRVRESLTRTAANQVVVRTVNTWDAFVFESDDQAERTFAFVRSNTTTNYDDNGRAMATISTDYDYDRFGNILAEDKQTVNHRTDESITRFVRTQYQNDEINWLLGQPLNIRTDTTDPGGPGAEALRETRLVYHPDRPWLLQQQQAVYWEQGQEKTAIITYDYDTYGNPTQVAGPRNPNWRTITDYSESDGMFPNTTTNALGHTVHRIFDPRFGTAVQETLNPADGDLQRTTSIYDEFGRIQKITFADGATKQYQYTIAPGRHTIRVRSSGMPEVTTRYDNLDRVIRETVYDGRRPGRSIDTLTLYDAAGRVWKKSLPHYSGDKPAYAVNEYDQRGRLVRVTHPDGTLRTIAYDGFSETITDEAGHVKTITKDSLGRLQTVQEPTGGITQYAYDLFDNLIWIQDPLGNQTHIDYDNLGRKIAMDDPYMGQWAYHYDAAGNLVWQKDNQDRIIAMTYDALDRPLTKVHQDTGRQIQYHYDEVRAGFFNTGTLTTQTSTEAGTGFTHTLVYNYDRMGRNVREIRTIDGADYTTQRQYDQAGRLTQIAYPDGVTRIRYSYNTMGFLERVSKQETDDTWTPLARYEGRNALGQIGALIYGNGAATSYDYWPGNHRLKWMQTTSPTATGDRETLQELVYQFDERGNVTAITDAINNVQSNFGYDAVSRLTRATAVCPADANRAFDQSYTYDLAGNMSAKTGRGGFEVRAWQDASKHIQPTAVRFDPGTAGTGQRDVVYNQDQKPTAITYNGQTSQLSYDPSGERVIKTCGGQRTIYVGGLYEIRNSGAVVHIFAQGRRIASITEDGRTFYTHTDHLGGTAIVTADNGLRVEEIGYLPYGATLFRKAYNNGDWTSVYCFTGQEFDSEYALYNYNARLYDPVLGRFISPDTLVPDWTDPQSLNRYAYCRNNPLKYVDPSGNFAWMAFFSAIFWGAAVGAAAGGVIAALNGGDVWEGVTHGALAGAVSGAMFYCAGSIINGDLFTSSQITNTAAQSAIHTVAGASSGAVNAAITGGDIGREALIGAFSAGLAEHMGGNAMASRMATGTITGGFASVMYGGDFTQGAIQGAWTSAVSIITDKIVKDAFLRTPKTQYGIWVEGSSPGEPGGHLSLGIGNPNGSNLQFSFGLDEGSMFGGKGGVYIDAINGGKIYEYYELTESQMHLIADDLANRINETGVYNLITNNCRHWTYKNIGHYVNQYNLLPANSPYRECTPLGKFPGGSVGKVLVGVFSP